MECPKCNSKIANENINIHEDKAVCQHCRYVFQLSKQLENTQNKKVLSHTARQNKPIVRQLEGQLAISVNFRYKSAIFVFSFGLLGAFQLLNLMFGEIIESVEDGFLPLLFLSLATLLGLSFSFAFIAFAILMYFGKWELRVSPHGGELFTGVEEYGIRKRFLWDEITAVEEQIAVGEKLRHYGIIRAQKKDIKFGHLLNEDQVKFVIHCVNIILNHKNRDEHWPPKQIEDLLKNYND